MQVRAGLNGAGPFRRRTLGGVTMVRLATGRRLAAPVGLALVALATVASAAQASAQQFRFPYSANPANECTGDFLVFDGVAHLVFDVSVNPDGSFSVVEHFNTEGVTATGIPSGDNYVLNDGTNDRTTYNVDAQPVETHTIHHLVLIHVGEALPGDDRYEHVVVTTRWSGGVPTVAFDNTKVECK
jgi:hypothetical protein